MAVSNPPLLHGWRLFVAIAAVLIAFALGAFVLHADVAEGSRAAIRVTARTSFLLFLAAFTASSFASLLPGPFTRFLLRERRTVGLSFAFTPAACHRHHQFRHPQPGVLASTIRAGQPPGHGGLHRHPGAGHHLAPGARPAHGTHRLASPARHRHVDHRGGVHLLVLQARARQLLVCGAVGTAVHRLCGALDRQVGAGAAPKRACAATAAEFSRRRLLVEPSPCSAASGSAEHGLGSTEGSQHDRQPILGGKGSAPLQVTVRGAMLPG